MIADENVHALERFNEVGAVMLPHAGPLSRADCRYLFSVIHALTAETAGLREELRRALRRTPPPPSPGEMK